MRRGSVRGSWRRCYCGCKGARERFDLMCVLAGPCFGMDGWCEGLFGRVVLKGRKGRACEAEGSGDFNP